VLKATKKSGKWGLGCWANKLCPLLSTVLRGKALSLDAISGEVAIWVKSYQSAENFGAFEEERRNETRASTINCGNWGAGTFVHSTMLTGQSLFDG